MTPRTTPVRYKLVYRSELGPFLTGEGPDPVGRRALLLLADADGYAEAMVVCTIKRRTNSRRSTVLLLLEGEIEGEPIGSVAYVEGNPFPITSAGRPCVVHVDNHEGDHVNDMVGIWQPRLSVRAKSLAHPKTAVDNSASP